MNAIRSDFPLIEVENVSAIIDGQSVLQHVSFRISNGERVVIMGETGSGKSSLLKLIAGIEMCETGSIFVNGKKIKGPQDQLIPGNPGICYMNQHAALRNNYKVKEILDHHRIMDKQDAQELYEICGISHLLERWSDDVSGGEKQRVLLASLLVTEPKILLLDEPFSNLDQINKSIIQEVLHTFISKFKMSVLLATHDPSDLWQWGDKLAILQNGNLIAYHTPKHIYHSPDSDYVAGLLGEFQVVPENHILHQLIPREKAKRVRSSQFYCSIHSIRDNSIRGRVEGVYFFGSYQILHVEIDQFVLKISSAIDPMIKEGDMVFINWAGD
jgi:iron(III) transport system ATP-binding protein